MLHRNPQLVHFLEHDVERLVGALQHRREGDVEAIAFLLQQLAGGDGLGLAFIGEADIGPAGEAVFLVPGRFAVAKEDDFVHGMLAQIEINRRIIRRIDTARRKSSIL
jgi:hypothetical protein